MTATPQYLQVRNWGSYQNADVLKKSAGLPPWIKNWVRQHWDEDYLALTDSQRGHLHDIRLLAARLGNRIPNDPAWVRAAIRSRRAPDLHALSTAGFLEPYDPATANDTKTPASNSRASRDTLENPLENIRDPLATREEVEEKDLDLSSKPKGNSTNGSKATKIAENLIRNGGYELTPYSLDDELSRLSVPDTDRPRLREMAKTLNAAAVEGVRASNALEDKED